MSSGGKPPRGRRPAGKRGTGTSGHWPPMPTARRHAMSSTHADASVTPPAAERPTPVAAERPKISKRRLFIYAMLFAMTAINYVDRVNLSVGAGLISHEFGL